MEANIVNVWDRRQRQQLLQLSGMDGAAIDYAIHGHAAVHISLHAMKYPHQCAVIRREGDSLLVQLPQSRNPLPRKIYAHFEINHKYFYRLHKAIDSLSPAVVDKLLPKESPRGVSDPKQYQRAIKHFTLDEEYQMSALKGMISSNPNLPYLVLGPFGTGKTHVLAAAVSVLFRNHHNHILVCTHQNQCADSIYRSLQELSGNVAKHAIRLVPTMEAARQVRIHDGGCIILMRDVSASILNENAVVVTTFQTALNLKGLESPGNSLEFTHILIDEGAQSREPEAIGALAIATKYTKIVIVGDNKQVCPMSHITKWILACITSSPPPPPQ